MVRTGGDRMHNKPDKELEEQTVRAGSVQLLLQTERPLTVY